MIEELTVAVEALTPNRTNNFMSAADVIYGGNVEKWIRLGNSLKLRLAMRMSYADPEFSRKAAEEVARHEVGCLETNADNPYFGVFGPNGNPINVAVEYNMLTEHEDGSACVTEGGDSHAAADIIAYMNGYNDPRRAAYFTPSEFDGVDFCGIRRGIIPPNHTELGHKYSGVKIAKNDPLCWMNAAEVAFLKAEAVAVFGYDMGGSAQGFYEEGIRLSFAQWGAGDATEYLADNTSCPAEYVDPVNAEYGSPALSNVTIAWNEAADVEVKQEKIITQKWIANWLLGNEAWADYRRTGYPKLMPVLDNRSNGIVDSNLGARRMPYPTEEITGNTENYQNAVNRLLNGRDNMATRLWFDCKNK